VVSVSVCFRRPGHEEAEFGRFELFLPFLVFILRAIHLAEDVILSKASAIAGQNLVRYRLPGNLFPLGRHNLPPLALLVRK
jgi:hypothetical protein